MEQNSNEIKLELLRIIPKILWVFFVAGVVLFYGSEIRAKITETTHFKTSIVEMNFKESLETYNEGKREDPERSKLLKFSTCQQDSLIRRIESLRNLILKNKYRILWLDDEPTFTSIYLTPILEDMGFNCDNVSTSSSALAMISRTLTDNTLKKYDVIVTDYDRLNDRSGVSFAEEVNDLSPKTPVIMFTFSYREEELGVPKSLFGLTHDAYDFLNLVLDAIERRSTR